jgi:general secretion pathway protein A
LGPRCLEFTDGSWQALAALNRPVLISLVNAYREKSYALVHRVNLVEGQVRSIELLSADGMMSVDVRRLGAMWDGTYLFLWKPPLGFDQALARGARGSVVTQIARDFAKLDNAPGPLAENEFNGLLHERVVAFQAENDLSTDGVVGRETLIALEAALGSAPQASVIVSALEAD